MIIDLSFHKALSGRRHRENNKVDTPSTPSGVTYDQFMQMSDDDKIDFIHGVISNQNITVPDYLDNSVTSKVIYALGMNNKPEVVSDSELDKMPGDDLYRTVYDSSRIEISGTEILDQIRYGDYTQLSGNLSSAYGRALYFATKFKDASEYGRKNPTAVMMRVKINPSAKIVSENKLGDIMIKSNFHKKLNVKGYDCIALTALAHGIDGWSDQYTMIINRGALTVSSTSKKIANSFSWRESPNAK